MRRQVQRIGAAAASGLIAIALLAGCAPAGDGGGGDGQSAGVLKLALPSEITTLDPSSVTSTADLMVVGNLYETLTRFPASGDSTQLEPGLAESWTHSDDGLTWTFTLREGATFHDGTPVDAEAVKFSIEHTIEQAQGSAYIWSPVDEIVAVDPRTVEFHLSYPAAIDLIASASTGSYIFSPTAVGDNGADWFNEGNEAGSGPYTLDTFTAGQQAVLTKFDDYWGGWEPGQFSTVLAKVVIDPSARQQALQSGDADWTFQIPNENLAGLADDPNIAISTTSSFQSRIILLNTVKGPLTDTRVRQAVSYAFPYDDVIEVEAAGFASKAGGPVPASLLPESGVTGYVTDLDKARSLLADAGYADGFTMTITTTAGDTLEKNTAALWAAELAKVGITLDIQVTAWPAQWAKAKGDPQQAQDAFSSYWFPSYPTPYDPLYNMFHTSDEPYYNLAYYDNPAFDELIDSADALMATDREAAMQKFAEAQQIIVDDAPAIFAMDEQNVHEYRSDLKGYVDNPAYPHMVFAYDLSR